MFKRKKKMGVQTPEFRKPAPPPPIPRNPNAVYQPAYTSTQNPPPPPTSGSNAVRPSPVVIAHTDIGTIEIMCHYETPCGWCTKWDKQCNKKIECGDDRPQRGLRAKAGIYDEAMSQSDAQEVIETIKSGKLPPLNTNNTYGLETIG